jgi:hypothetical protein
VIEQKKLNVLVISIEERNPKNSRLYEYLSQKCNLVLIKLTRIQARKFYNHINFKDCDRYDRVLVDLPFRLIFAHVKKFRRIKRLVFYEEDSCQNYIKESRWHGKFSKFYKSIPGARALTTSGFVATEFIKNGIDAVYIGKAFDESVIYNKSQHRPIKHAFVGRTGSKVYELRKKMLNDVARLIPLKFPRAEPGPGYNDLLNEIVYFISSDAGLGEYMIKNYEALAAGCLLCTYRIPSEDGLIGFKDMVNVVLYSSADELVKKIDLIESNRELKKTIIENGLKLTKEHTFQNHANVLLEALSPSLTIIQENDNFFRKLFDTVKGR